MGISRGTKRATCAAVAAVEGINTETHLALVIPDSEISASSGLLVALQPGASTESGDIGDPTLVPSSYANYQVNDRLYLGLAINGQYGFNTKPDNTDWVGSPIAITSEVFSVNFNPTLAYKLTPELTLGVGAQIQYFDVRLRSGAVTLPVVGPLPGREVEGDDIGFGVTAGVIWAPTPDTSIGLGFRSAISHTLDGTCKGAGLSTLAASGTPLPCNGDVEADLTLPELVSLGIRQRVSERLTLLGTVEWTNWSRLGTIEIKNQDGGSDDVLPLEYDDGWFFSAGFEYDYSPETVLRAGVAWEKSPISDEVRTVLLPDNDRLWLSAGATHKLTERVTIDLAYTHIFVDDAPIETNSEVFGNLLTAEGDTDIDIISAAVKFNWGGAEPPLEPLK